MSCGRCLTLSKRMRVVGWNVQPVVMVDDGDNLTPVQVQPLQVPQADWQAFVDGGWQSSLETVREQVEDSDTTVR